MSKTPVERWMLPDGIEEILPPEALQMEQLRRQLLDLCKLWGYELVIAPMVEFTDSLLVGLGKDVDLLTFKVTDQLSGRSMGIRADMTPQIARMDAHSLNRSHVNRLCYAGHVLKTKTQSALDTRSPMQVGAELFGEPSLAGELEVVSLVMDVLQHAQLPQVCLDLGHVAIFRALARVAGFTPEQELTFFNLLQAKALTEIAHWVEQHIQDPQLAHWLVQLPRLSGARQVLDNARTLFAEGPEQIRQALDELEAVADVIEQRFPQVQLYFDLGELSGYHYLTGMVFAVFVPGRGSAIVRGGRYDHIGEVFGRARPAIGFSADLAALSRLGGQGPDIRRGIFAPPSEHPEQWLVVQKLRAQGERVVCSLGEQATPLDYQDCDRVLTEVDGELVVRPI